MARVIYTLPLPGGEIDGIRFTEDRGQLVSDDISEEVAARLATIHGFQAIALPPRQPSQVDGAERPKLAEDGGPLTEDPPGTNAGVPAPSDVLGREPAEAPATDAATDAATEPAQLTPGQRAAQTRARNAAERAAAAQQQTDQAPKGQQQEGSSEGA